MAARMAEQGVDHLWLDATGLERFSARFPTIAASLSSIGLDPEHDWLPIAPAAHHLSGGVVTDLWGATALPGLWAVGEVACTGVHGANRLASNSLLEGMVFGARLAERIPSGADGPRAQWRAARRARPRAHRRHRVHRGRAPPPPPSGPAHDRLPGAGRHQAARHAAAGHDAGGRRRPHRGVPRRRPRRRRRRGRRCWGTRRRRSAPGSWPTCSSWPTRCWSRRAPAPRAGAPTPRREYPETDPSWRRRLVHGRSRPQMRAVGERERGGRGIRPGSRARPSSGPWPRTSVPRAT